MSRSGLLRSSLGRKYLMGVTGLFLCLFLIVHLVGNLQLYIDDGGKTFNEYTKFMSSNPLINIMSIILFLGFLIHIIDGLVLWAQNAKARPETYAYNKASNNKGGSSYARTMKYSGTVVFVFLVIHLATFWYRFKFGEPPIDEHGLKDMHEIVTAAFSQWWYSALYVVSMILLASHVNHGFQSAFRTFGMSHPKYAKGIKIAGSWFAVIISAAFASFPIYFYFTQL